MLNTYRQSFTDTLYIFSIFVSMSCLSIFMSDYLTYFSLLFSLSVNNSLSIISIIIHYSRYMCLFKLSPTYFPSRQKLSYKVFQFWTIEKVRQMLGSFEYWFELEICSSRMKEVSWLREGNWKFCLLTVSKLNLNLRPSFNNNLISAMK